MMTVFKCHVISFLALFGETPFDFCILGESHSTHTLKKRICHSRGLSIRLSRLCAVQRGYPFLTAGDDVGRNKGEGVRALKSEFN